MRTVKLTIVRLFLSNFVFGQNIPFDTNLVNNKNSIHIKTSEIGNDLLLLTSNSGTLTSIIDTIQGSGLAYIKYPDFNKDGNADILADYYGNNSTYFLYLFDPVTNAFRVIDGYASFPDAIQLKTDTKYYYSYHRAGCSDMNWVSDLFKIENFKIIHLGHIYGQGCEYETKENPQVIEIYKVLSNDEQNNKLVNKLPYQKYIPEFSDKWTFIKEYWNKNYVKFENKNYR